VKLCAGKLKRVNTKKRPVTLEYHTS